MSPETELRKIAIPEELTHLEEEGQVMVHISTRSEVDMYMRIWPTTFLVDHQGSSSAKLLRQYNISMAPEWTFIPGSSAYRFTLVFERLPKECVMFDLLEIIPEPGGFSWTNILRNKQDVYWLRLE